MSRFRRHLKYGVPFVALVVGSPFLLKEFQQVRFEYKTQKAASKELVDALNERGIEKRDVDINKVLADVQKEVVDDYQIVRGPRPWEEPSEEYKKQLEELKKKRPSKPRPEKSAASYGL